MLQETRGSAADFVQLRPDFLYFGSFGDASIDGATSKWGGVIIAVRRTLAALFDSCDSFVLQRGRLCGIDLRRDGKRLRFVNVHIDPALTRPELRRQLGDLKEALHIDDGVAFLAGDFNIIAEDDFRYQHQALVAQPGDGWASGALQEALSEMTEMRQEGWTYRRFDRGCMVTASRIDRAYISLRPDVLHRFVSIVCAAGCILDRDAPSDHLPLVTSISQRRRRDPRVDRPIDRRTFEDPRFYQELLKRCAITGGLSVADAYDQLTSFKAVARALARERDLVVFRLGEQTPRDCARLAMRALRLWHARKVRDVERLCSAWGDLAAHFVGGELVDETEFRRWLAALVEGEALAELHAIGRSEAPDASKQQARDRVQARVTRWRVRMPRVLLKGLADEGGTPLVTRGAQAQAIQRYWGAVFGNTSGGASPDEAERFLQAVPDYGDEDWSISLSDLESAAVATTDTSPGPDGLPYAFYRGAEWTVAYLWVMFRAIVDGEENTCAQEFGLSVSSMLPKATGEAAPEGVTARVNRARPISCCNTDYKIVIMAFNRVLTRVCQRQISPAQRGFIRGRSIAASIALTEAAMCAMGVVSRTSAAVFLDFRNAFPSLLHAWLRQVLVRARVPRWALRLVDYMYTDCLSLFSVAGEVVADVRIKCGVRQGCPASGSLFAIAVDPVLRVLAQGPGPRSQIPFAFADDLTVILRCFHILMPIVVELLERWSRVSGLALQTAKCEIVPLVEGPLDSFVRTLVDLGGSAAEMRVRTASRCLGVVLGPDAVHTQWSTVAAKILPRTADVLATARGLAGRLMLFRTHILSLVLFKAQFVEIPAHISALLARSLQRLAAAPWMCLPVRLMESLDILRFPTRAPVVGDVGRAALVRCALAHREEVREACADIEAAHLDDDAPLAPPLRGFRQHAIVVRWAAAIGGFAEEFPSADAADPHLQRSLERSMYEAQRPGREGYISRLFESRACRWVDPNDADELAARVRTAVMRPLPVELRVSLLKTFLYGWCTNARFKNVPRRCVMGCGEGADEQAHYFECGAAEVVRERVFSYAPGPGCIAWVLRRTADEGEDGLRATLACDLLLSAFDAKRHGSLLRTESLVLARLKELRRRHPCVRTLNIGAAQNSPDV